MLHRDNVEFLANELRPLTNSKRRHKAGPLSHLTPRQWDVLELIAQGYTNAAIAERLFLTEKSVENYINVLYQQLSIDRSDTTIQPRVTAVLKYWRASMQRLERSRAHAGQSRR